MRARWKGHLKDVLMILIGVVVGLCLTQYLLPIHENPCSPNKRVRQTLSETKESTETISVTTPTQRPATVNKSVELVTKHPSRPTKVRKKVKRPKYLRDELHIRHPLYIGVVTAADFLNTRATAVNNTWAKKAPKVEYFSAINQDQVHALPVVSLPGVDDTYPPQKKVYRMLRYMHDNYIDKYNWFMRADDDAYVRIPELMSFLSELDPSEPLYIGSPGFGRENDLERIKLHRNEHYCMGGPGVIFSRALLIKLTPHLDDCLKNVVVSWNEDLEVGRCISRRLDIQCTWAHEMRKFFYMDYTKGAMFKDAAVYRDKLFNSLITIHPFKSPDMMYRVHQFFLEIKLKSLDEDKRQVNEELEEIKRTTQRIRAFP